MAGGPRPAWAPGEAAPASGRLWRNVDVGCRVTDGLPQFAHDGEVLRCGNFRVKLRKVGCLGLWSRVASYFGASHTFLLLPVG